MFILAWASSPPSDKTEWIAILREVLAAEAGSYRVVFRSGSRGWRFELEWREDTAAADDVVANGPEGVAFNIYSTLAQRGKPMDPAWRPRATGPGELMRHGIPMTR